MLILKKWEKDNEIKARYRWCRFVTAPVKSLCYDMHFHLYKLCNCIQKGEGVQYPNFTLLLRPDWRNGGDTSFLLISCGERLCWWAYLNKTFGDEKWTKKFLSPNKCNGNKSHEDRNVRKTEGGRAGREVTGKLTITATAPISLVSGERNLPSPAPRAIPQIC